MKDRPKKMAPAKKSSAKAAKRAGPARKHPARAKTVPAAAPARTAHPRLLSLIVRALDAKKTERIQVLRVADLSSITDYLVLGTATSEPHLRALRVELEKVIDAEGTKILGMDTTKGSGWVVVDAFDVMVHLFTPEYRERYRLDLLWRDATEVPQNDLMD